MPTLTFAPLLHLLGFLAGAALYALLMALASRRQQRFDYLPVLTAVLGLLWNVIGLAAYGIRDFASREPSAWLVATAYSALGFLPPRGGGATAAAMGRSSSSSSERSERPLRGRPTAARDRSPGRPVPQSRSV